MEQDTLENQKKVLEMSQKVIALLEENKLTIEIAFETLNQAQSDLKTIAYRKVM